VTSVYEHEWRIERPRSKVRAWLRASAVGVWTRMMRISWKRFGSWCERTIPNNWLR
jgi:hypothetical protein